MKKLFAVLMLLSISAFAADTQPVNKDGAYYIGKGAKKVFRVAKAIGKSSVVGLGHVAFVDAPKVGVAVLNGGVHAGKDVVNAGKAVKDDAKQ